MRIPLSRPDIAESDIAAVNAVLRTPQLSLGPRLEEFERAIARYAGTSHAVAVNSGTSALHLCMLALGVGPGDEVIVPSFAFIAVANAVRYVGALPVFVDIDADTLNIDHNHIEAAISSRTRAIIPVHTFGRPAALGEILDVARRNNLAVIEDACEALGAAYENVKVGSYGDAGVFAFYPNKQITTGEGGILVTNSESIASRAKRLRNQGRSDSESGQHDEIGYSYRMSELNCALGREQLNRIDTIVATRASVARKYDAALREYAAIERPPLHAPRSTISWFVYVVRLPERCAGPRRDFIVKEMAARGIGCRAYFAPIHMQPAYRSIPHRAMDLQVTESLAKRTLALPFYNQVADSGIEEVCETLGRLIHRC